jgi:enoyl-[acyl-carrier-protein] reductase (NADH)
MCEVDPDKVLVDGPDCIGKAAAAFMASDLASGMTGTTVNQTMGSLDD